MNSANSKQQTQTTAQLAAFLEAELIGDDSVKISDIKPLEDAGPEDISFIAKLSDRQSNRKREAQRIGELARNTQAGALLVSEAFEGFAGPQIVVENPMAAVIRLAGLLRPPIQPAPGVHPSAIVGESVELGEDVSVGAYAVIGDRVRIGKKTTVHPQVVLYPGVSIGEGCVVHAGAVIRENVELGNDCLVQSGVVIGGDGFGYLPHPELGHQRIPHIGNVRLEDHVDVGANSTIDRATLGQTRVGTGTKIDNLVMIGHNVRIGKASILCGQVGVSGSSSIGSQVILAGQVGVADHVTVGDKARAAAQAGISRSVEAGRTVAGTPEIDVWMWRRISTLLMKLPELFRQVKDIQTRLNSTSNDSVDGESKA